MIVTYQKPERKKVKNYRKRKKKTVLIVGDSMLNGTGESKLSKIRHIHVQPILGGKIEDIKDNLMIHYMKNYKR